MSLNLKSAIYCRRSILHASIAVETASVQIRRQHAKSELAPPLEPVAGRASNHVSSAETEERLGPMHRRLLEATEEAILTGGRAGQRAVQDAGFPQELRDRLLEKVAASNFRQVNSQAFADAGLDDSALSGHARQGPDLRSTTATGTDQPWQGEEVQADAVLRMLTDAHKPLPRRLRGRPKVPSPKGSNPVDMRVKREQRMTAGQRAASARDKASIYSGLGVKDQKVDHLTEEEREAMRQELRDRFAPGARALPNTISGLTALANERIEDAIARGQFKDIPRGKDVVRDTRANNPFIDTTEYIMNNMIKRQDIVPPWIEKQQELVKAANVFRARLRNDWKRHAARMISSNGGTLLEQINRAEEYHRAEEVHNPRKRKATEEMKSEPPASLEGTIIQSLQQEALPELATEEDQGSAEAQITLSRPFRDAEWEKTEKSYMELAIKNLNALTRSYNLMAPELAKKPYYSLPRELNACFADVAPEVAGAIKERATRPVRSMDQAGSGERSVFQRLTDQGSATRVYESRTPHYGLREMWRDWWQKSP